MIQYTVLTRKHWPVCVYPWPSVARKLEEEEHEELEAILGFSPLMFLRRWLEKTDPDIASWRLKGMTALAHHLLNPVENRESFEKAMMYLMASDAGILDAVQKMMAQDGYDFGQYSDGEPFIP